MNIKTIILIFLNLLIIIKTIESKTTIHKGSNKNTGNLLFGDQYSTSYNYHKSGSLFSVTISGFDVFNYTSLLSAPFLVEHQNLPIDKSGISVIGSGFCYTNQQQILFSIYYFALNQNFYIQLLQPPNSYCQNVHIFGTTVSWVVNDKKIKNKHPHNHDSNSSSTSDSSSQNTSTTTITIVEDIEINQSDQLNK